MDTATSTRPRFRSDLVAQPIEDKGQVFVDVTDPDSGTTFRFYEIEYSVACAMDGARTLGELRAWARDELGVEPSDDELGTVVATLDELGYLDAGASSDRGDVALGQAGRSPARTERPPPPSDDVELGHAGGGAPGRAAVPASSAPEAETSFEGLMESDGVPSEESRAGTNPFARSNLPIQAGEESAVGARPAAKRSEAADSLREGSRKTDDEDGPTNIPAPASQFDEEEVSVDLSDHLPIGRDDVKEAVRQSQVMEAEPPPAEPDAGAAKRSSEAEAKEPVRDAPARPDKPEPEAEETPAPKRPSAPAVGAKPVETPAAAEAGGGGARIGFVVVLILALLGGGGYYAYAHLGLFDTAEAPSAAPADAEPPPEPEAPKASLSEEDVEPVALEASDEGEVIWVAEAGEPVAEGDEVVRLAGYERVAEALERYIGEETRLQDRLDQATAEDDRRAMRQLEEKVEEAQSAVGEVEAKLAGFRLVAPEAGLFEPEVAEGDEVEEGDPMGTIAAEPRAIGVFEVEGADAFSEGQAVTLTSEGAGEVASCEVTAAGSMTITVACPPGSPFGPGDTVALESY